MVDEQEMRILLEQSGIPFKYHHWNKAPNSEPPPIPFGVFVFVGSNNLIADNSTYHKGHRVRAEIYTELHDPAVISAFENVLDMAEIPYQSDEIYIDSEKMWQISYTTEVVINAE